MPTRPMLAPSLHLRLLSLLLGMFLASRSVAQPVVWPASAGGNDHMYQAFYCALPGISWNDADAYVSSAGHDWHLATITSAAENAFVYDLVDGDPRYWNCCSSGNSAGPWLGGISSCNGCNDWAWVTGEPWQYTNWGPLEPFGNGDALGLFGYQAQMGPHWNDVPRTRAEFGYVIECPVGGDCPELQIAPGCALVPVRPGTWGLLKALHR